MIYDYLICDDDGNDVQLLTDRTPNNAQEHARGLSINGKVYRVYSLVEIFSYQNGNDVEGKDYTPDDGKALENELRDAERSQSAVERKVNL